MVHESSNLSEANKINMVSHVLDTTTIIPQCGTQAEGKTLLDLRQNLSACKFAPTGTKRGRIVPTSYTFVCGAIPQGADVHLPNSSMVRAPQKMISMFVGDGGSIPSLGFPAVVYPLCLPDNGAGIFYHLCPRRF
jgi:hypothetical protein